jgi:cytochrome c-type biogenesis protein CcmH/NrfG
MTKLIPGILLLLALVGLQIGLRRLNLWRVKKAWEAGNEAAKRQDWHAAERALRTCVKKLPMWTASQTLLGVVLARNGKLDEAEDRFRMAANLEPKNPEGYFGLLYFYATHRPKEMGRAADTLREAFIRTPALRDKLREDPRLDKLREDPALKPLFE